LKIGLVSDTHDNIENIEKSVKVFRNNEANIVIHAGDYVSPQAIRAFQGVKLVGVYGNNDFDKSGIRDAFNDIGGQIEGDLYELEIDGMMFAVYHGTQQEAKSKLVQSEKYDIIVCGHTHRTQNTTVGKTIVVNPGTANGWFFGYWATVATFDTLTKVVDFINL
jgi:putative phosphoesterase